MGCLSTRPADGFGGHVHPYDEFCLITGGPTTIQHAGSDTRADHGSCYLFKGGERHGFRNDGRQAPHLWVLHFWPDPSLPEAFPVLGASRPERRIWQLREHQIEEVRTLFLRILAEQDQARPAGAPAAAAWLRLLAIQLARAGEGQGAPAPGAAAHDPEVLALWQVLNDHLGDPSRLGAEMRARFPSYDALRHRFTRAFGASPRQVLLSLRLKRAKSLLLESDLPIQAIAERVGYARQHEFARAFHREVGRSPTSWRASGGDVHHRWQEEAPEEPPAPARRRVHRGDTRVRHG